MIIALCIIGYLIMWGIMWSGSVAYFQGKFDVIANETYRQDVVYCGLFSALPFMWVCIPFLTEFFRYGFQIWRRA